ncbi:hypothetical protein B9Z55_004023 [Caenorhabditis nigoni]|uniref:Arrestin C-terminal-like domain-containing protein n=1 Tax=Caenorhabditis nigoni TaxID=1611254 RepID=A0A2G5UUF7_9PELO|nr:hypothetical protein B9Z55_004023 [Caenorhabditis nigoni]
MPLTITPENICFTNPAAKYAPGETVRGTIELFLLKDYKVRYMHFKVKGVGKNSRNGVDNVTKVKYFNQEVLAWDEKHDHSNIMYEGRHTFPFSFSVPIDCPPTFHSAFGDIQYYGKITMVLLDHALPLTAERCFTVTPRRLSAVRYLELQNDDNMLWHRSKKVKGVVFNSGRINAMYTISKKVIVPGESVSITARLINESRKILRDVSIELHRVTQYYSASNFCYKTDKHIECSTDPFILDVKPGEMKSGTYTLFVPQEVAQAFNARIITVSYVIQMRIKMSGLMARDIVFKEPVLVATKPSRTELAAVEGYAARSSSLFNTVTVPRQLNLWINEGLTLGALMGEEDDGDNSQPPTYAEATASDEYPPSYDEAIRESRENA